MTDTDKSKTFVVYVTKYALTQGIRKCHVTLSDNPKFVRRLDSWSEVYAKNEWHILWNEAYCRAIDMRIAKLKSLEKSIARLQRMTFEEPT